LINFKHIDAASTQHAVSLLAQYGQGARVLAGGQDLLFRIKKYIVRPECVVNIKTIPGLKYIRSQPDQNLRIGALATLSQIAQSVELQRKYTVLAQAAGVVASPQIRNMGTIAGNICQDVWCWYLQDGFSCWKSGGKFCDLAGGDSRYYGSIMGGHLCLSNHPSDTAVALAALDAQVHVASPRGKQTTAITDFLPGHTWVGDRLQSHTLGADEMVTEIEIPFRPTHSAYVKFALRKSWDFAIASAAVSAVIQDGIWNDVRVVLGGVATSPYRSREAEDLLRNQQISDAGATEAADAALQHAKPLKMNGYKVDLSKTLVRRALLSLAGEKKRQTSGTV
jgi:xanthine dehydrogenase YagS FAD-binding subunit